MMSTGLLLLIKEGGTRGWGWHPRGQKSIRHGVSCNCRMGLQSCFQIKDVVDDILDDFQFGQFLIPRHVGDKVLQFGQEFGNLLSIYRVMVMVERGGRRWGR